MEYKTVFINSTQIMQELRRNIAELGIRITRAEINQFDDLDESIIFNCAGIGAKNSLMIHASYPCRAILITLQQSAIYGTIAVYDQCKSDSKYSAGHSTR